MPTDSPPKKAPKKAPKGGGQKTGLKRIPKWGWVLAVVVLVGVYIYMKRRSDQNKNVATGDDSPYDTGQLAASLGGQPNSTDPGATSASDDSALLYELMAMFAESQGQFEQLAAAIHAGGVTGASAGASGATGGSTITVQSDSSNPATSAAPAPTYQDPAASFYAAGTGAATGGANPLYAYSRGVEVAESPIAGSVFSPYAPASQGYEALGVHASDPITFVPTPITNQNPPENRPLPSVGHAIPV